MTSFSAEPRKKMVDADSVLAECTALEKQLAQLRALYETHFRGEERRPPTQAHETFKLKLESLRRTFVQQTAARFRVDALEARFHLYERLWLKSLDEMERGVFRRDVARMKRKTGKTPDSMEARPTEVVSPKEESVPLGQGVPVATHIADDMAPTLGAGVPAMPLVTSTTLAPRGPAVATSSAGVSDDTMQALYLAFVAAKQRCNEDVSKLSLERLSASIRKQVPELLKQHEAKALDFKVVIRDGKAVLRAVPKK